MIWFSQTIQYRIWPPRPSLEYLLNYKIFSGFPSLDKTAKELTEPVSQRLVPDSFFPLGAIQTNYHIFQGSSISKLSILGDKTKPFLKEIFISTERKNCYNFWQVGYYKWRKVFFINSIFFYCNLNPNRGLRHIINSSLIALWNFLSFPVSQFVTSLERPALTFLLFGTFLYIR